MEKALAAELLNAGAMVQYNEFAKSILSNKLILAWILKEVTEEFKELSIGQIASEYLGEQQDNAEKITGDDSVSSIPKEGEYIFDVRTHAYAPHISEREKKQKVLFDIEVQKDYYPGYQIVTRGIFYGGRMLSGQGGTEFTGKDFDSLKKVYSIWLCLNGPEYIGNAISKYEIKKRDIKGKVPDFPESYDKMTVVLINLNRVVPDVKGSLTRLLNVIFSPEISAKEKIDILGNEFEMEGLLNEGEEFDTMCNFAEGIYEAGISKGINQGIEFQVAAGIENIMKNLQIPAEKACEILGVTMEQYNKAKENGIFKQEKLNC